ncbi:zinc-binding alcohol dehydrogenase family protein [Cysteiniphilum halobium]|uniref:zinc-binding alcohol dehydrogenase family protein n=1 Tax=Cysteiniphilum halobium TaxID=2219059 RepID=UPI003F83BD62
MKAIGLYEYLPISNPKSLLDLKLEDPLAKAKDILVEVKAVSVNPVDTKVRRRDSPKERNPKILGWDASGVVKAIGDEVTQFEVGDHVFYAGDITRQGSNSELQLVDSRIVGKKPKNLSFSQAAAFPLVGLTAWEALFEKLQINKDAKDKTLLIIGGAGGVGSIAIQLAKQLSNATIIATASRHSSIQWTKNLGADHIINHHESIKNQLEEIGYQTVDYILCLNSIERHWKAMSEAISPQGEICSIVESSEPLDLNILKAKSVSFHWELMYTKSLFQIDDIDSQGTILNSISRLIDDKKIQLIDTQILSPINAKNLKQAHELIESGSTIGKIVLEKW